jgi:hypothetical protein
MANKFITEAFRLLGFQFGNHNPVQKFKSFAIPANLDGASQIASGGIYGTYVDLEGTAKNEAELITRYRDMAMQPECEQAIEDIITDSVVQEDNKPAIQVNLEQVEIAESIKTDIRDAFDDLQRLLNFNEDGMEIFRRWYVDGRLFYHIMVDPEAPTEGIKELRYLDPRRVRKIREIKKKLGEGGVEIIDAILEYYLYNERGIVNVESTTAVGVKIAPDSICYVHSGQIDSTRNMVVSYLHKAIKPLNQLRAMEDAHVIYRLSRAAERRVFYIDVGNMPTIRAEQYIKVIMNDFRNKLVYDSNTGEVRDDKKFLSMQEDFFLPRREGGRGTEVTTLPAGTNLGQIEDIRYFQERLYKALHVPTSRLSSDSGFGMGRSAEISRDEIKFSRFVTKLRKRFDHLFKELLKVQLLLKQIIVIEDWDNIKEKITFDYQKDSVFQEAKEQEIWTTRMELLSLFDPGPVIDRYVSRHWLWKTILRFNDDEIELMQKEIDKEKPIADAEAEKTAALETGEFFDTEKPTPKKKAGEKKKNA